MGASRVPQKPETHWFCAVIFAEACVPCALPSGGNSLKLCVNSLLLHYLHLPPARSKCCVSWCMRSATEIA